MKKRCDNPYGDVASVVAAAKAADESELYLRLCANKDCGAYFRNRYSATKYCPSCAEKRRKEVNRKKADNRKMRLAQKANKGLANDTAK